MIKNYLKITCRNLIKDRQFTLLNLAGLSTGLACALLIWLWLTDELQMDKYNPKDEQLYQVMQNIRQENGIQTLENTAGILAKALATEMPEVEYASTVVPASWFSSSGIISFDNNSIKAGGQFISKDFFNMFSCSFIEGDKNKLLTGKHFIAISDELAQRLFHTTENVVGKSIEWNQNEFNGSYLITGIFRKNPAAASMKFDALFNFDLFVEKRPGMQEWGNSDPYTYVLLKEGTNVNQFNNKIRNFFEQKSKETGRTLFIRRFSDKYLYGQYTNGIVTGGRITYVKLFSLIAIFILVIACINFMNLSTAKASRKVKEVGIKKVVGARRLSIIMQYLGESVIMSFLSLFVAVALIIVLLPAFNDITGKTLTLRFSNAPVLSVILITLITGIVAGSYPAFYISGFKPAVVLKGKLKTSLSELWIRKGLVVFQFTLSVIAIAAAIIIYRQVNYIQFRNPGYSRDNVIDFAIPLEMDPAKIAATTSFVNELKNISGVIQVGSYYHNLNGDHGAISDFQWPGKDPTKTINFSNLEVGYGFIETVGIKMKEGRSFSNNNNTSGEIIFNESAIKEMWLKDPIGETIKFWGQERQIVGVAEDFNFESLYQTIKPCFFQAYPVMPNVIVKIKHGTEKQTIEMIKKIYSDFNKGLVFDYKFLDAEYQALYVSETRVSVLSKYFTGLAIIISCLGLFGLAAFTAQRKQKEIGIRKIVGATVSSIVIMLSKDFMKLILFAVLLAFPLTWLTMNNWLSEFAYRISIGMDVFLLAGISILLIAIVTVSFQAIKAAVANPVKSLRTE